MAPKKVRRARQTKQTVPPRKPGRPAEPAAKTYRVIAVSLYLPEAQWVDETTAALQRSGNPKANRSFVVREAILRLQESLSGRSGREIVHDFAEQQSKRSGSLP